MQYAVVCKSGFVRTNRAQTLRLQLVSLCALHGRSKRRSIVRVDPYRGMKANSSLDVEVVEENVGGTLESTFERSAGVSWRELRSIINGHLTSQFDVVRGSDRDPGASRPRDRYHPMSFFRRRTKISLDSGLVNRSANCSSVSIFFTRIESLPSFLRWDLNQ